MINQNQISLTELKERAKILSKKLTDSEEMKGTPMIIVRIANEYFAFLADAVSEVISYPKITFVPSLPSYVSGAMNLRGEIIGSIDLRVILGLRNQSNRLNYAILFHIDNTQTAVLVEKIEDLTFVTESDESSPLTTIPEETIRYIKSSFYHNDLLITRLKIDELINDLLNPEADKKMETL